MEMSVELQTVYAEDSTHSLVKLVHRNTLTIRIALSRLFLEYVYYTYENPSSYRCSLGPQHCFCLQLRLGITYNTVIIHLWKNHTSNISIKYKSNICHSVLRQYVFH